MISSPKHPESHPRYLVEIDLGSSIFCNNASDKQHG